MSKPTINQALAEISLKYAHEKARILQRHSEAMRSSIIASDQIPEGTSIFCSTRCPRCESQQAVIRDALTICTGCDQERIPGDGITMS